MISLPALSQRLRGIVIDKELQSPIPGALVILLDSSRGFPNTVTDVNGQYLLQEIPLGRVTIRVISTGYEDAIIPNVLISSGKDAELNIRMTERITQIREVEVKANSKSDALNQMATISTRTFSTEEASRYAGSFNDPARMAQSYAGVAVNNDRSNELVIRGNSPRGVLWKIEGIEVPPPSHFSDQGSSGGAISMLSAAVMSNSEFYTGAFPADQGNALSGVFDINLRKGNTRKREYALELGVLGADATLEGLFKKGHNSGYLINYRYSALTVLKLLGFKLVGDAIPTFTDLSWNIHTQVGKSGQLNFFGITGKSFADERRTYDTLTNSYRYRTDLFISGISYRQSFGTKTVLRSTWAITAAVNGYFEDTRNSADVVMQTDYESNFRNRFARWSNALTHRFNSKNILRAGVIASLLNYDYYYRQFRRTDSTYVVPQDERGVTWMIQAYASWKHMFNERLALVSGIHYMELMLNNRRVLEPRLGFEYRLNARHRLSTGVGIHSRAEDISIYMATVRDSLGNTRRPNESLSYTRAAHAVLGYDFQINPYTRLKTETYFQHLWDVPVSGYAANSFSGLNYGSGFTTDSLTNTGFGRNYGMELTLERFLHKGAFYLITGSVFSSKYSGSDGIWRNTRYNGNFAFSINGGKEWTVGNKEKGNAFGVSTRFTWAGGRRYSPLLIAESTAAGFSIYDDNRAWDLQYKDYLRADIQFFYRRNRKKMSSLLKLDIQNVTNRLNTMNIYFDRRAQEVRESTQLGIVPVLSYRVSF